VLSIPTPNETPVGQPDASIMGVVHAKHAAAPENTFRLLHRLDLKILMAKTSPKKVPKSRAVPRSAKLRAGHLCDDAVPNAMVIACHPFGLN